MDKEIKEIKEMFELIIKKIDNMDTRLDNLDKKFDGMDARLDIMEKHQDEMYVMQRALEENVKVTRANEEKILYILADIQGKVTKLTEEVEEHESIISQIRAIK